MYCIPEANHCKAWPLEGENIAKLIAVLTRLNMGQKGEFTARLISELGKALCQSAAKFEAVASARNAESSCACERAAVTRKDSERKILHPKVVE